MRREIRLDGGEISILKALGLAGTAVPGRLLLANINEMETGEMLDSLNGLLTLGYVLSNRVNLDSKEDVERSFFRVNPSYARDLRDAVRPSRRRDQRATRRRRRS